MRHPKVFAASPPKAGGAGADGCAASAGGGGGAGAAGAAGAAGPGARRPRRLAGNKFEALAFSPLGGKNKKFAQAV